MKGRKKKDGKRLLVLTTLDKKKILTMAGTTNKYSHGLKKFNLICCVVL